MKRYADKTVLVTGGNSGIGLAAAKAYAAEGARVIITGRDATALKQAADAIGPTALALRSDAASLADGKALAHELTGRGLRLDAVFINAGIAKFASLENADETLWNQIFDTNVKGPYFQLQALLPLLNQGAAIVINGSINAHIGMPDTSIYAASKAALVSMARTLSAELLPRGVRVNVVSPGPVSTPIYNKLGVDAAALDAVAGQIQAQIPLGRFGTPEEIASTVLHLTARESAFIVGTEVIVDGGMSQL
ncbi:SDR family oxidoreductase [Dyella telluris]|uniref:SDR family oxidoreductase n=1 Tax=Dyella telluris TaxID=2763498 RepID=A0A7G8Q5Y8_9GAMM|nr:SDR family oxidoreductase [Dyella telluris]QNK02196.1 SDR family oxidoreductase [Dyella telluris]